MPKTMTDIFKPFCYLLDDALGLLWLTENIKNDDFGRPNALPRQTVLTLAMVVEGAANCCLETFHSKGKFMADLERLTTLGKFDVYLLSRGSATVLDRGAKHVQPISDLKTIRDNLVHPKASKRSFQKNKTGRYTFPNKSHANLNITSDCRLWTYRDAEKVFKAVIRFFDYFFIDLCKHSIEEVRDILFSEINISSGLAYVVEWSENSPDIAQKLGLESAFLSLVRPFKEFKANRSL